MQLIMSTLTYEPAWNSVLKFIHFREERDYTRVDWKALYLAVLRFGHDARSHLNLLPDLRGRGKATSLICGHNRILCTAQTSMHNYTEVNSN